MRRPRVIVLGSCAGIGSEGFVRAGFDAYGLDLDHRPQKYDPHPHAVGDMLALLLGALFRFSDGVTRGVEDFDLISAHPPCQGESALRCLRDAQGKSAGRPLVDFPTLRGLLNASGLPWVMENVERAPLLAPARTCGSSFGLGVRRHRLWESSAGLSLTSSVCDHARQGRPWGVYGSKADAIPSGGRTVLTAAQGFAVMGVDRQPWTKENRTGTPWGYLCESIPPAFSAFVAAQVREQLAPAVAA